MAAPFPEITFMVHDRAFLDDVGGEGPVYLKYSRPEPSSERMIVFASCVGSAETYRRCALLGLQRAGEGDSVFVEASSDRSIFDAYNEVLEEVAGWEGLEALVLLHEDTEILDPELPAKLRRILAQDDIGIVGVVGARDVRNLRWWEATTFGRVVETRGLIDFGGGQHDVEFVDGLFMALSPRAARTLRFDGDTFTGFHGYDADLCFAARAAGLRVVVDDIDIFHHTKRGYGHDAAFAETEARFEVKWAVTSPTEAREHAFDCVLCGEPLAGPIGQSHVIVTCQRCGIAVTLPPPSRDISSDGIFVEQYGGGRLAMRGQWFKEAEVRLDWVARHISSAKSTLADIGCATGELPAAAQRRGWRAVGIEPSVWAAEQARALGVTHVLDDLGDWLSAFRGERAEVVTCFHVLEHVHEPASFLTAITNIMSDDGLLFLEVPNIECSDADRDRIAWAWPAINDHVLHFSPNTLSHLLSDCGYEVLEITPLPTMIYDPPSTWAQRCAKWTALGDTAPSSNLLRAVATQR